MTRAVAVLEDGTRVYAGGARYKPKPVDQRLIGVNRPADPLAVRYHTRWFLPLELLDDNVRTMPESRPDEDAYEHMDSNLLCRCEVCQRPEAERWRRKWRRERGIR